MRTFTRGHAPCISAIVAALCVGGLSACDSGSGYVECDETQGGQDCSSPDACEPGYWGDSCEQQCQVPGDQVGDCLEYPLCDRHTGESLGCKGCDPGWYGPYCLSKCQLSNCRGKNGQCSQDGVEQVCGSGCVGGWVGPGCQDKDSDLDGVADRLDPCPNNPTKSEIDACGCDTRDPQGDCKAPPVISEISPVFTPSGQVVEVEFTVSDPDTSPSFGNDANLGGWVLGLVLPQDGSQETFRDFELDAPCPQRTRLTLTQMSLSRALGDNGQAAELGIRINGKEVFTRPGIGANGGSPFFVGVTHEGCATSATGTFVEVFESDGAQVFNEVASLDQLGWSQDHYGDHGLSDGLQIQTPELTGRLAYAMERMPGVMRLKFFAEKAGDTQFTVVVNDGTTTVNRVVRVRVDDYVPKINGIYPLVIERVGDSMEIPCEVSYMSSSLLGEDDLRGVRKDGVSLDQIRVWDEGQRWAAVIPAVTKTSEGNYQCIAASDVGTGIAGPITAIVDAAPTVSGPAEVVAYRGQPVQLDLTVTEDFHPVGLVNIRGQSTNPQVVGAGNTIQYDRNDCIGPVEVEISGVFYGPTSLDGAYPPNQPARFEFFNASRPEVVIGSLDLSGYMVFNGQYAQSSEADFSTKFISCGIGGEFILYNDTDVSVRRIRADGSIDVATDVARVGKDTGDSCSEDVECASGRCLNRSCYPSGQPSQVIFAGVLPFGDGTHLQFYRKSRMSDTIVRRLTLTAPQAGEAILSLSGDDGWANENGISNPQPDGREIGLAHNILVRVGEACNLGQATAGGAILGSCSAPGDPQFPDQICNLTCPPGQVFAVPAADVTLGAATTVRCERAADWVNDEGPGAICVDPDIELAPIVPVTVPQGSVATVELKITDRDSPLFDARIDGNGVTFTPRIRLSDPTGLPAEVQWWFDPPCTTPREVIVNAIRVNAASDVTDEDDADAVEIELRHGGQTRVRLEGLTQGDSRSFSGREQAFTVCGDGRVAAFQDNQDVRGTAALGRADDDMGAFIVARGGGQPCTQGEQCASAICNFDNRCAVGDVHRQYTARLGSISGSTSVEIDYQVVVPRVHTLRLHHRLGTEESPGFGVFSGRVTVSDGNSSATQDYTVTVQQTCEAPSGNRAGDFRLPEYQVFPADCSDVINGGRCKSKCMPGAEAGLIDWGIDIECRDGAWVETSISRGLECTIPMNPNPPDLPFSEVEGAVACPSFGYFKDSLVPQRFPMAWAGGDKKWAHIAWHFGGALAAYNRQGLADHRSAQGVGTDITRRVDDCAEDDIPCWIGTESSGVEPWELNPGCLEDGAYAYVDASAEVTLFSNGIQAFGMYFGGEVVGGRVGGECGEDSNYDERSMARAQLDAYVKLAGYSLADEHKVLPDDPALTLGPQLPVLSACKSVSIAGVGISACGEIAATLGVEIGVLPSFALPAAFGLALTATPRASLTTEASVGVGNDTLGASLNLSLLVADLSFENVLDTTVQTGLCASEGGSASVAIQGDGELKVQFPSGTLSGELCLVIDCYERDFFTFSVRDDLNVPLYSWDKGIPVEL